MQPKRWKMAVMIWLGIYPLITLVLYLLGPILAPYPLPVKTLGLTMVVVPTMVFLVLPQLQLLLGPWLRK